MISISADAIYMGYKGCKGYERTQMRKCENMGKTQDLRL